MTKIFIVRLKFLLLNKNKFFGQTFNFRQKPRLFIRNFRVYTRHFHFSFRLSCDFKTCNSDHFGKFGQKRFLKKIRTQKSEYKFDKHGLIIIPFPHGINSYTDSRMSDGNISYITMLMDVKGCVC